MSGALKSKSFQPLAGVRYAGIFFGPYLADPGLNRRINDLKRKPVDARLSSPIAPECRPCPVADEPEPAHAGQVSVIVADRIARHRFRGMIEPDFHEMLAGQGLQPSHWS
jgi:hypothetical protein